MCMINQQTCRRKNKGKQLTHNFLQKYPIISLIKEINDFPDENFKTEETEGAIRRQKPSMFLDCKK